MMRKTLMVLVVAFALLIAGCGGSSAPRTVKVCSGTTDICHTVTVAKLNRLAKLHPFQHCKIVDVSDYQGLINWPRAAPYICGGITKAGEASSYGGGGYFAHNWTSLHALGLWHSAYWFVRGTASCATQASLIIGRLNSVNYAHDATSGPFMLDIEVPGANGGNLGVCIDGYIFRAFHRHAEIYTASGTWPGGSHGSLALWQAQYASFLQVFWTPVNLWQCTDGVYGCVSYTPGIGYGDASSNLGVTSLVPVKPKPPTPHCLRANHPHTVGCGRVRYGYSRTQADLKKVQLRQRQHQCSARVHPRYCAGWKHAVNVDTAKLAAFRRIYG